MVPVLVCTRTRLDTKSVFLQRGQVMRKEGEKRRKKTGQTFIQSLAAMISFFSAFFMFKTPQEEDQGSNRRKTNPGEQGAFMTMDTWKMLNAFMAPHKKAMKGHRASVEGKSWRLLESQVQAAAKKRRNLLFSIRIGIIMFIVCYFHILPYIRVA